MADVAGGGGASESPAGSDGWSTEERDGSFTPIAIPHGWRPDAARNVRPRGRNGVTAMSKGGVRQRLAAVFARAATRELVKALRAVDARPPEPNGRMVRAWLIEELEKRYPVASAAVQAAFEENDRRIVEDAVDVPVDYVEVLVAAIPADQL